jgi:peroxiredoxin
MLEAPPKTQDVALLKKHRKEKNEKIVKLSQQAISLTHKDAEKERVFNLAVHNLMEARMQLALAGDAAQVELLNEDAVALFKRDPKSAAAAEAAHAQVNLAYGLAKGAPADDAKLLIEFATAARYFAENFPGEERRSLPLLFAAGRSCELPGLNKEALGCYVMILKRFPNSPFAARVTPIVRRMKLAGKPPKIVGPTVDGDQVNIDDMLGKVVLVVFWSSQAEPFQEMVPRLMPVLRASSRKGLQVVGVNLDQEPALMQQFVVKHKISWPQIFFPEPEKRGWNNPIASRYGITDLPALWLVDQNGNVVSTTVKVDKLPGEIDKLLGGAQP